MGNILNFASMTGEPASGIDSLEEAFRAAATLSYQQARDIAHLIDAPVAAARASPTGELTRALRNKVSALRESMERSRELVDELTRPKRKSG